MTIRRTKQDPTGQARNRKRARAALDKRLNSAKRAVVALFLGIPRRSKRVAPVVNADETIVYTYDLPPEQLVAVQDQVRTEINRELETTGDRVPPEWFYKPEVEQPYRQGTGVAMVDINALIAGAVVAGVLVRGMEPRQVTPEAILTSRAYREALNFVYVANFNAIKTLSQRTADQVIQRINAGIGAGKSPTDIAADISERFDVARSNAQRIADTEVNAAFNNAQMNAVDVATEQSGLDFGVTHISALMPTTRDHHAARHGLTYTTADQTEWWDSDSNRINCHCSTKPVRLDENRRAIHSEVERKRLEEERAALLALIAESKK